MKRDRIRWGAWFCLWLGVAPLAWSATTLQHNATAKPRLGITYFLFFDGPGLAPESRDITPNVLGLPEDDGLRLTAFLSARYALNARWALDFQSRVQWIVNNARGIEGFQALRWQSPRIGLSGKLLQGEEWSLSGAINTDLPYFIPAPLGAGFVAERRTTILNPGLFAKFVYRPNGSRWSVFSLVMPRFFLYADRDAAEPQLFRSGLSPRLKPELSLSIAPTLNYALSSNVGVRLGTELTYRKLVLSGWNPFHGSLNNADTTSDAWRLAPVPLRVGLTYEPNEALNVSVFAQGYPLSAQRVRRDETAADFAQTLSIGMWISGVLL